MAVVCDIPATAAPAWSALRIERLDPHADLPPLAQAFAVALDGGPAGLAWVGFADALAAGGFGRAWVAAALDDLAALRGVEEVLEALSAPGGLRLSR